MPYLKISVEPAEPCWAAAIDQPSGGSWSSTAPALADGGGPHGPMQPRVDASDVGSEGPGVCLKRFLNIFESRPYVLLKAATDRLVPRADARATFARRCAQSSEEAGNPRHLSLELADQFRGRQPPGHSTCSARAAPRESEPRHGRPRHATVRSILEDALEQLSAAQGGRGAANRRDGGQAAAVASRPATPTTPRRRLRMTEVTQWSSTGVQSSKADSLLAEVIDDITSRLQAGEPVDLNVLEHPERADQDSHAATTPGTFSPFGIALPGRLA